MVNLSAFLYALSTFFFVLRGMIHVFSNRINLSAFLLSNYHFVLHVELAFIVITHEHDHIISPFPGSKLDWTFRSRSIIVLKPRLLSQGLDLVLHESTVWTCFYDLIHADTLYPECLRCVHSALLTFSSSGILICVGTALVHGELGRRL